ncbi:MULTISPECIES: HdeD family acid-resistance protein [Sphingobacterium]|uniref:HdeD family acid-resistance protein n=2 Tax=Sphingobacterium TaxID=28453 RepID=A0ABW5Z1Z2_9SPHI|nr:MULTISPECIES: HdeD family acid-resistance protein [Sphingobacterium]MCS3554907.1 uncharacterized membrane protein HdeD (DUF308 family) [Sphingobacterium sp. JUb21]MCW2262825.1 uncharacterized membrane protein HdeD (DUF308 family) [Sphingobacterium kitahiroshimense]NJI73774.1 HdeD family acid-resistance protein [Sphingobacterium sp. B16(2022)]TCR05696.1 uncharacterized membrane protein HdeD (DUF308 family) [Sphingobacterium sp. JUb20]TCR12182.1 uncharacterized membrane protein HdeD (DUF308 f
MEKSIVQKVLKFWYLPLIAGILYIIVGVYAAAAPFSSFLALSIFLSVGILISGVFELFYALSNRKNSDNWGWHLVGGMLNLFIGVLLIANTGLTALMLSVFIGVWLLFRSIATIANAFEIKRAGIGNWGWILFTGILGVLFSFLLLWNPLIAGITIGIWMGIGLITVGVMHVVLSLIGRRLKKINENLDNRDNRYSEIN